MREFSVPASFEVGEHDNIVSSVYAHEREDPNHVIFQRLIDGDWMDVTAAEVAGQIRSAALGLIAEGIKPGDRVGLLSATRYEWPIMDFAILSVGALTVPIYETSSAEQVRFVLGDAGAVLVFAETDAHAEQDRGPAGRVCPNCARCSASTGRAPSALDALAEAGKSVDARRARCPAGGHQGNRSGHADLHLGHDRQAQGLPADALQPGLRDPRRQGLLPDTAGQGRAAAGVPSAGPRAGPRDHHRGVREQGDARLHQRHQEPGADVRRVQADAGGVGAAGVREGLQHGRAERPQRRQGQDLRGRGQHRDRVERGAGQRRCRVCCCAPSTRCSTGWSTASCARRSAATATPRSPAVRRWVPARPLLPRRRPDHLRGLRPDRDQRRDHREPDQRPEGRLGRKAVAGQQHAPRRR